MRSIADAKYLLESRKEDLIEVEENVFTVTYKQTDPYDIPDEWLQHGGMASKMTPNTPQHYQPSPTVKGGLKHLADTDDEDELNRGDENDLYHEKEQYTQEVEERPTRILLSNLQSCIHKEYLETFFESPKYFGVQVKNVELDEDTNSAIVEFDDPDDVDVVLGKRPVKMMGKVFDIEVYTPEQPEPLCTIQVKGPPAIIQTVGTFLYFFNERLPNGENVQYLENDSKEDVLYASFETEEIARAVADRLHKVGRHILDVSLYVPPKSLPSYDNKVLIKGLSPKTTQDSLLHFIEAKSGFKTQSMTRHAQQKDVVMVTMEANRDFTFKKLEKMFTNAKLEGNTLKLARVPITDCIIVYNLPDDMTTETIQCYFENQRRSGGGPVRKIVMNDDNTCFVYFTDFKRIDTVLERLHKLENKVLSVQKYHECLARPEGEIIEWKVNKVSRSRSAHRLIVKHHKDILYKISKDLHDPSVQVTPLENYEGFEVRGTKDGIRNATTQLNKLLDDIKFREYTVDKPGLSVHIDTLKGKDCLCTIESTLQCTITVMKVNWPVSSGMMPWSLSQMEELYARPKTNSNKVTFIINAMSEDTIDKAIEKLERFLEREVVKKVFKESVIRKMDDNQLMEIRAIAHQHHLNFTFEEKHGHIEIHVSGFARNVLTASDNIHRIIREAVTLEQQQNSADILSNLVQWYYIEIGQTGQTLRPYDKDLNFKIENAYKNKAKHVIFRAEQVAYILDFQNMAKHPIDDPSDVVCVIRRDLMKQAEKNGEFYCKEDGKPYKTELRLMNRENSMYHIKTDISLGAFEPPATWTDMTGNLRVVNVQPGNTEYQSIEQTFAASSGGRFTVNKIKRVQNKTLWQQYQAKKKQLENQNPQGTQNERLLWHGPAPDSTDYINAHGFIDAYYDELRFTADTRFSSIFDYPPDTSGVKRVYLCRVLTGEYTEGQYEMLRMRLPPQKLGAASSTDSYDLVVDSPARPLNFTIFHDTQAYPEYLLSLKLSRPRWARSDQNILIQQLSCLEKI